MEAEKLQDLQSASQRPRSVQFQSEFEVLRTRKASGIGYDLNTGNLLMPNVLMFLSVSESWERSESLLENSGRKVFLLLGLLILFCSLVDWMRPTYIRKEKSTTSVDSNMVLIHKHPPNISRIMFDKMSSILGPVKLTDKINYHKMHVEHFKILSLNICVIIL